MTRIKRGFVAKKRRKKILNLTKGFIGSHSKLFTASNQQYMKALRYAYYDRRKKKNQFKKLWIQRINGSCLSYGKKYSNFINELKKTQITLDKKIISKICIIDISTFEKLVKII